MSARPAVSVVLAARLGEADPTAALAALRPQLGEDVELLLVTDVAHTGLSAAVGRTLVVPGALVPELWAAGLRAAAGEVVALSAGTLIVDPDWVGRARSFARGGPNEVAAVGGAFRAPSGTGAVDHAVLYCRYSRFLPPLASGPTDEVPGDNALYRLDVLRQYEDSWRDGFWEPFVHALIVADGHAMVSDPELVVRQADGLRLRGLLQQRFRHGRAHGLRRSSEVAPARVRLEALTAPLVPPLMTWRTVRAVWPRVEHRSPCARAVPLLLLLYTAWAAGELVGRLAEAGRPRGTASAWT